MTQRRPSADPFCWKKIRYQEGEPCDTLKKVGHCRNCPKFIKAGRSLLNKAIPEGFLEECTDLMSHAKEVPTSNQLSVVVFRLQTEWFALRSSIFHTFSEIRPIHVVPLRSNHQFLGLVNIGGELLPCLSSAAIMGLSMDERLEKETSKIAKRLAMIGRGSSRFVFQVDEALGVIKIPAVDIQAPPATVSQGSVTFTKGIFSGLGHQVSLLDEDRVLQAMERSLVR